MPWPVQSLAQSLSQSLAQSLSGAGKVFIPLNTFVFTRDSEAYLRYNEKITHFPNPHEKPYVKKNGIPLVLIEDAKQNLVKSNLLDGWSLDNLETPSLTNGPLGVLDAWEIIPDATSGTHGGSYSFTPDGSSQYCVSFVIDGNDYDWAQIELSTEGFTNTPNCYFNLSSGVAGTATDCDDYGIYALGNGWYLIWIVATSDAAAATNVRIRVAEADTDNSFSGNSSDSMFVWCPQVEVGAFPSSRIRNKNLITYSDSYRAAVSDWWNPNSNISDDQILAPDGISLADKIYEDTTPASTHYIYHSFTTNGSSPYCFSLYLKSGERSKVWIDFPTSGFSVRPYIIVDLAAGTIFSESNTDDYGIEDAGNGWYRCWFKKASTVATTSYARVFLCNASGGTSYDGDGSSGLYMWRAQIEVGDEPTDAQYTGSTLDTRVAGQGYWAEANVPSWVYTGKFKMYLVPNWDSTDVDSKFILEASGDPSMYMLWTATNNFKLRDLATGLCVSTAACTFSKGQLILLTLDYDNASITVEGCTTGNGTYVGTQWVWSGNLQLGQHGGLSGYYWDGLISPPVKA